MALRVGAISKGSGQNDTNRPPYILSIHSFDKELIVYDCPMLMCSDFLLQRRSKRKELPRRIEARTAEPRHMDGFVSRKGAVLFGPREPPHPNPRASAALRRAFFGASGAPLRIPGSNKPREILDLKPVIAPDLRSRPTMAWTSWNVLSSVVLKAKRILQGSGPYCKPLK